MFLCIESLKGYPISWYTVEDNQAWACLGLPVFFDYAQIGYHTHKLAHKST